MTDSDHTLRNRVARLLQLASEARATGRHAVADQFTERAAELLEAKSPLVIEDSEAGVTSASAAGFAFVRVASVAEMVVRTIERSLP